MTKIIFSLSLLALVLTLPELISAGTPTTAPQSIPEIHSAVASGKKSILFFMNPAGGPCNAQNEILQKLLKDRKGNFNIVYVSTMKPEHQKAFYDYGVRSLPWVTLLDGKGRIAHHFPPGIQSYEALSEALDKAR